MLPPTSSICLNRKAAPMMPFIQALSWFAAHLAFTSLAEKCAKTLSIRRELASGLNFQPMKQLLTDTETGIVGSLGIRCLKRLKSASFRMVASRNRPRAGLPECSPGTDETEHNPQTKRHMKITKQQVEARIKHLEHITGWQFSLTSYGVERWQNGCCTLIVSGKRSMHGIYISLNSYIRGFEDGLSFAKQ